MNTQQPPMMNPTPRHLRRRIAWRRALRWTGLSLVALLLAIQFVPYGREHDNPAIPQAVAWNSARTETLARQACYDCHSNETRWPWYSNIAPVSWLVQRDVDEGRAVLNFSEWDRSQEESEESVETVQEGEMPLRYYTTTHWDARLSEREKQELIDGFLATFGTLGSDDD